jgi:hypothetical protein
VGRFSGFSKTEIGEGRIDVGVDDKKWYKITGRWK